MTKANRIRTSAPTIASAMASVARGQRDSSVSIWCGTGSEG